jgi:phosphoribosylglycinamide formyltransferase 1
LINIGILITGPGTIVNAILSAWSEGKIRNAKPKIIISSSRDNASMLELLSKRYAIKTEIIEYRGRRIKDDLLPDSSVSAEWMTEWKSNEKIQDKLKDRWENYDRKILELLIDNDVTPDNGLICLAEYRLLISNQLTHLYKDRILNIHPSLLPSFPGWRDVLENTLNYGVKVTGVTVHMVNDVLDSGAIIAQVPVPVFDGDDVISLRQRLLKEAYKLYPYCINLFATGQTQMKNGILQGSSWKESLKEDDATWSYANHLF